MGGRPHRGGPVRLGGEPHRPRSRLGRALRRPLHPRHLRRRPAVERLRREAVHQLAGPVRLGARTPLRGGRRRRHPRYIRGRDDLQRVHPDEGVRGPLRDRYDLRRRGLPGPQVREAVRPLGRVRGHRDNPARDRHGATVPICSRKSGRALPGGRGLPGEFLLRPSWS